MNSDGILRAVLLAGLGIGAGCGSDSGDMMSGALGGTGGGAGTPPLAAGTGGGVAGGGGGSGMHVPPSGGAGAAGGMAGGMAGSSAGSGGGAGSAVPEAGASGSDGESGTGAEAGTGGGGTGGAPPSGDAFAIRGPDPTAESANGMNKGPYTVESYTSGYADGTFDDATIWYPTDADPPFGCVSVVPGFVSPQSSIRNWGPFLASHGIVTITIGVPGGDQPAVRATKLMSALDSCVGENTRSGSPLEGKIDPEYVGVSGWSMGGGGTLIAASQHPELKAAVSFAAWGPTGGAMDQVPVLMFEATADPLAANMSDGYYAQVPETVPKFLFEVQGSSHNVANDPANHGGVIGLYGLSWWKVFLEGDERYRQFLTGPFPSIATMKTKNNL